MMWCIHNLHKGLKGKSMDKLSWIKELVLAEQQMEESGMVDMSAGFNTNNMLEVESIEFLQDLKAAFIESASAFNQLKGSSLGNIKIYGISNTRADFMLFRNGFKLIFAMAQPGQIKVYDSQMNNSFVPGQNAAAPASSAENDFLNAKWGPFGELHWTYQNQTINLDYLVRYYMSRFIRESAK